MKYNKRMKQKVLATSWHPGGINTIVPVIRRLKQEGNVDVVTVGHEYSEAILDNQKISYKKISDYGLEDVSVQSMEKLLKKESPSLILTGTSAQDEKNRDAIEQTITLAGRRMKIPTVGVLDFWGNYSERFNDIYSGEHFKFLPDKIAIMDQYAQRDMLKEGFDKERLVITGNPHFDDLEAKARKFTEQDKITLRKQIGLRDRVLFFYAANAWKKDKPKMGYWDLDNIKLVNDALRELPEDKKGGVIVKLHPRVPKEDLDEIKEYLQTKSAGRIKLVTDIHPQELVLASDLTLTPFSTLGIESVYMGKPCISMQPNLQSEDYLAILTKNNIIPVGYTPEDCKSLVGRAFADDNYRERELINQASSFRTDGKATERVTNLVNSMFRLNQ
jgi:hypothetical protein